MTWKRRRPPGKKIQRVHYSSTGTWESKGNSRWVNTRHNLEITKVTIGLCKWELYEGGYQNGKYICSYQTFQKACDGAKEHVDKKGK